MSKNKKISKYFIRKGVEIFPKHLLIYLHILFFIFFFKQDFTYLTELSFISLRISLYFKLHTLRVYIYIFIIYYLRVLSKNQIINRGIFLKNWRIFIWNKNIELLKESRLNVFVVVFLGVKIKMKQSLLLDYLIIN